MATNHIPDQGTTWWSKMMGGGMSGLCCWQLQFQMLIVVFLQSLAWKQDFAQMGRECNHYTRHSSSASLASIKTPILSAQ